VIQIPSLPAQEPFHLHNKSQAQTDDEKEVEMIIQVLQYLPRDHYDTLREKIITLVSNITEEHRHHSTTATRNLVERRQLSPIGHQDHRLLLDN
jgi:hypothetical protein